MLNVTVNKNNCMKEWFMLKANIFIQDTYICVKQGDYLIPSQDLSVVIEEILLLICKQHTDVLNIK